VELRGGQFRASLLPDLQLEGTTGQPVPVGQIQMRNLEAGGFFIDSGALFFFPDQPWNPFLLIEGAGWFANQSIHAFAFGPLNECKWILSAAADNLLRTPQDFYLAVEKGWEPLECDSPGPVDMRLYLDSRDQSLRVVSSRIEPDSVWRNGVKFSDSLDFSPDAGIYPMDSFRSGFEWKFVPKF
jgi:hypothetical protein